METQRNNGAPENTRTLSLTLQDLDGKAVNPDFYCCVLADEIGLPA